MIKKVEIEATYKYTIEVDENNPIVQEYADMDELLSDLVVYRFSTLPVLRDGVKIIDVEAQSWETEIINA